MQRKNLKKRYNCNILSITVLWQPGEASMFRWFNHTLSAIKTALVWCCFWSNLNHQIVLLEEWCPGFCPYSSSNWCSYSFSNLSCRVWWRVTSWQVYSGMGCAGPANSSQSRDYVRELQQSPCLDSQTYPLNHNLLSTMGPLSCLLVGFSEIQVHRLVTFTFLLW